MSEDPVQSITKVDVCATMLTRTAGRIQSSDATDRHLGIERTRTLTEFRTLRGSPAAKRKDD